MHTLSLALFLFLIAPKLLAGENVLLVAGGYEGNDRHFLFDSTAASMAQTLSARGWRMQSVYGEAGHSERHRQRLGGADTFLTAEQIAEVLAPLLRNEFNIAVTLDSCSSGQVIDNLSSLLGDPSSQVCIITSTNTRPYVSNRGIIGNMMEQLRSR